MKITGTLDSKTKTAISRPYREKAKNEPGLVRTINKTTVTKVTTLKIGLNLFKGLLI
jgi:hypothetical protein